MDFKGLNTYTVNQAIHLKCVEAKTFPEGISEAHAQIRKLCDYNEAAIYYGISHPDKNKGIIYMAGADEKYISKPEKNTISKIIPAGDYIYTDVNNYSENLLKIGQVFDRLTHHPDIDPEGFCLEWYLPDTICRCMIRLKPLNSY